MKKNINNSKESEHLIKKVLPAILKKEGIILAKKYTNKHTLSETQRKEIYSTDTRIPRIMLALCQTDVEVIERRCCKKNRRKVQNNKINNLKNKNGKKERIRNPRRYARVFHILVSVNNCYILVLMKTAYIFHDAFSDPLSDWYPWMKTTLESFGYQTMVPKFPTPAGQSLESWRTVMNNYTASFDEETVLVGHGTGGLLALRMIEQSGKRIRGLFIVAGYAEKIGHAGYDRVNETFLAGDFNWETISSRVMTAAVFAGDGDPFVPRETSERLAQRLGTSVQVIPEGGHINRASGFTQLIAVGSAIRASESMIARGLEMQAESGVDFENPGTVNKPVPAPEIVNPVSVEPVQPAEPNSGIHTMYQDMTNLVNSDDATVTASLLGHARADEESRENKSPTSGKNIGYIIGSLVVVGVAIAAIGFVVYKYVPAFGNPGVSEIPSLIAAESHVLIEMNNQPGYAIAQKIRAALAIRPGNGSVTDIYYMRGALRVTFLDTLRSTDVTTVPQLLESELSAPAFMHGSATVNGEPAQFLIVPITNYDVAFRGMQEWEQTLVRDVGLFMNMSDRFLREKTNRDTFTDELIANRTVRVARYYAPQTLPDETPQSTLESLVIPTSASTGSGATPSPSSTTTETPNPDAPNFISTGIQAVQQPIAAVTAPYQEGDIMVGYFFLNERTLVIIDNVAVIPEILARYANAQIYR